MARRSTSDTWGVKRSKCTSSPRRSLALGALPLFMATLIVSAVTAVAGSESSASGSPPGRWNGRIAYMGGGGIVLMNPDGRGAVWIPGTHAGDENPSWSPDGERLAIERIDVSRRAQSVWVIEGDGSRPRQLTFGSSFSGDPAWSPNGDVIAFESERAGVRDIWLTRPDGREPRNLTPGPAAETDPAWSPDGRRLAFARGGDIWTVGVEDGSEVRLTAGPSLEQNPAWSPDGAEIAFDSDRSGTDLDVWAVRTDGSGVRRLTDHPAADARAAWSPDGKLLVFQSDRIGGSAAQLYLIPAGGGVARRLEVQIRDAGFLFPPSAQTGSAWAHRRGAAVSGARRDVIYSSARASRTRSAAGRGRTGCRGAVATTFFGAAKATIVSWVAPVATSSAGRREQTFSRPAIARSIASTVARDSIGEVSTRRTNLPRSSVAPGKSV